MNLKDKLQALYRACDVFFNNKNMNTKIIYSNYYEDLLPEEEAKESLMEDSKEEPSDERIQEEINFHDGMSLNDAKDNLNIELDGNIIAIASIGRWNGRRQGYKLLNINNIKDCLYSEGDCDYCKWYVERGNLRSMQSHHDGTNYIEYREIRNEDNIDTLLNKLYSGDEISRSLLNYYTKPVGKEINKVFGW